MPRRVLMLVNPTKPAAAAAAAHARPTIERLGKLIGEYPADSAPLPETAKSAQLIVVFGGDGTILSQARRCLDIPAPLLGVDVGRLGFLAEFDLAALEAQAPLIFGKGPLDTDVLGFVRVRIFGPRGAVRFSGMAMNDAVVTAGPPYRLIALSICIDGQEVPSVRGDGLIVSTSVGSTAYNMAAGGPILAPRVDGVAITPIAPQSLSFRPVVVPSSSRVELRVTKANREPDGSGTTLVLDGQISEPVNAGDRIVIDRHDATVRLVRNPISGYWARLTSKLQWAASPRLDG